MPGKAIMTTEEAITEARRRWEARGYAEISNYRANGPSGSHPNLVGIKSADAFYIMGIASSYEEAFASARMWWMEPPFVEEKGEPCVT